MGPLDCASRRIRMILREVPSKIIAGNPTGAGKKFPRDPAQVGSGQVGNAVKSYGVDFNMAGEYGPVPVAELLLRR